MSSREYKTLYTLFIITSTVAAVATLWNIREGHKLRKLQAELTKVQLDKVKNGN
jgi:hypothetical protein